MTATSTTTATCTKAELLKEAERIRAWTYDSYAAMRPRYVEQFGFPTRLSSDAIHCIQKWIDTDTAWCQFSNTDEDFANVTLTVCEKMKKAAALASEGDKGDPAKILVWFARDPDEVDAKIRSNHALCSLEKEELDRGWRSGPVVRALAMIYSLLDQMISVLPERCRQYRNNNNNGNDHDHFHDAMTFDVQLLELLKKVDGTAAKAPEALSAIASLLDILGDGMTVMINAIDYLWGTTADDKGERLANEAQNLVDGLMGTLGRNRHRMRLWVALQNGKGDGVYRETGYSKMQNFRIKPIAGKLSGRLGHALTELRFH
ncbi:hypothetical protein G7054_g9494 [Neopestalotiopsis clavispora]|nr:hypothetical protein G7054_g9494 [Neopestalotiopsis clavispora]